MRRCASYARARARYEWQRVRAARSINEYRALPERVAMTHTTRRSVLRVIRVLPLRQRRMLKEQHSAALCAMIITLIC